MTQIQSLITAIGLPAAVVGLILLVIGHLRKKHRKRFLVPGFLHHVAALLLRLPQLFSSFGFGLGDGGFLPLGSGENTAASAAEEGEPLSLRYSGEAVPLPGENELLILISGYEITVRDNPANDELETKFSYTDTEAIEAFLLDRYTDSTQITVLDDYAMTEAWKAITDTLRRLSMPYRERKLP